MKILQPIHSQKGLTLLEILLVLAIVAVLAAATFIVYPRVQSGRSANYEAKVLGAAQGTVKSIYTRDTYDTLDETFVRNAEVLPKIYWQDGGGFQNQWDGAVMISPSTSIGETPAVGATKVHYFKFVYENVPTNVCIRLAGTAAINFGTIIIAPDVAGLEDPANIIQDNYSAVKVPLDETKMAENCKGTDGKAAMAFVSN